MAVFYTANAQEIRVIDNKGTIQTIRNNQVTVDATAPTNPIEGDVWYDTNTTPIIVKIWVESSSDWEPIPGNLSKTIILNRNGGSLPNATNTFFDLPLTAANLVTNNPGLYSVTGTSEITIIETGNYLISGELSATNMPAGDTKYILGVFVNGIRVGYLSRGFASLPARDYWGTTGTLMYQLNANDIVKIRYVLNAGSTLNSNFSNIGITKI
ncbi:MAG: hypothetical protein HKP48_10835 [Winogradskyella sp.]|uniref:hypothetical protein n=1 Tax=Winogradskyella sp. TaxID=1883156 RepID=UPI0017E5BD40|nr:hypothetical protein [Winogradskyella sp.]MBT8244063.1 hypothetical protein [Winogradskyella sp.]NNK23756.1 hypothetical protein [Winogradskyella sp.]